MNAPSPLRSKFDALDALIRNHAATRIPVARPRQMRAQLTALQDPAWGIEWRMAQILLLCHCRQEPARTHGKLMALRDDLTERAQEAEFDTFMQLIRDTLHPEFITPHGYTTTFSELDAVQIFKSMGSALLPLEKLGQPFFLYAGALLGHIRNGKLIDHDDDIDVAVMLGECTTREAAQRWLAYKENLGKLGLIDDAERMRESPILKFRSDLGVDIDLFPAWTTNGKFSVYPYSLDQMDISDVFPLGTFGQDPLMLPANPEALLAQSYGKDWRIPDPLFHINWKQKRNEFSELFQTSYALSATRI